MDSETPEASGADPAVDGCCAAADSGGLRGRASSLSSPGSSTIRPSVVLAWLLLLLSPFALGALLLGLGYTPDEIAANAHWRSLGLPAGPACSGCLLCGMSRAFSCLGHWRFAEAVALNPYSPLVYALFWLLAVSGPLALVWLLRRSSWVPRPSSW